MKTALITGAAQRIGQSIAQELLASNYKVILCANNSFKELQEWSDKNPYKNNVKIFMLFTFCANSV